MKLMKELEDENRRLKKCMLKDSLRLKSPRILSQKSGEASWKARVDYGGNPPDK